MRKQISSVQNPYIKELFLLKEKSRIRKKTQTFLIEGLREISLAIKGGYTINTLLVDMAILNESALNNLLESIPLEIEVIEITSQVHQKLATRTTTEGILAVANSKDLVLETIKFKNEKPLILVAEAPEKPGNIGALLRTADAAGIDAVFIANPKTDLYNPNIIRSSVGCLFTTAIATGTTSEIISFLKEKNIDMWMTFVRETGNTKDPMLDMIVGTGATWHSAFIITKEGDTSNFHIPNNYETN